MSRRAIRRWITELTFRAPRPGDAPLDCLWSKGIAQFCDVAGPEDYWLGHTEAVQPAGFFRAHYAEASGLVWVRLGTAARRGETCDLDLFVRESLPTIHAPFVLVTTDGDLSVPSELAPETVRSLLASPFLVAWATQNHDGGGGDPRIRAYPIGLDLHSRRPFASPRRLLGHLARRAGGRRPPELQAPRVFCDLGLGLHSEERQEAVRVLAGCPHVAVPAKRVSQTEIWRLYAGHPFVLSAVGHGLDCHRTWEALMLGSIVITRTSPLDPLFADLPIVIVDDWNAVRDPANLVRWAERYGPLTRPEHLRERLRPAHHLAPLRARLAAAAERVPSAEHENGRASPAIRNSGGPENPRGSSLPMRQARP